MLWTTRKASHKARTHTQVPQAGKSEAPVGEGACGEGTRLGLSNVPAAGPGAAHRRGSQSGATPSPEGKEEGSRGGC